MFRAIIIALAGAAALSAGALQAGGSCPTKGKAHAHIQRYEQHYAQRVHVKPVYVKPVHIEPAKVCYYKLYYKLPCWDYQKQLTFENLGEAKQMAQMLYDNGYKVALTKLEGVAYDKVGGGKTGGLANKPQLLDSPILLGNFE